jgi:hypothetical protein
MKGCVRIQHQSFVFTPFEMKLLPEQIVCIDVITVPSTPSFPDASDLIFKA